MAVFWTSVSLAVSILGFPAPIAVVRVIHIALRRDCLMVYRLRLWRGCPFANLTKFNDELWFGHGTVFCQASFCYKIVLSVQKKHT
jgi:hypothetical protein